MILEQIAADTRLRLIGKEAGFPGRNERKSSRPCSR